MSTPNIVRAARELFGLKAPSFEWWLALLASAFACAAPSQSEIIRTLTHREPLMTRARELWLAIGRRAGKSRIASMVAIYLAIFCRWVTAPGEVAVVMLFARDRSQAKVLMGYVRGILQSHPLLRREVLSFAADSITLVNGVVIEIATSDHAAARGRTIVAAILDEFAFWGRDDATELLRALRPAQATTPGSMLVVLSSVYSSNDVLTEQRKRFFGTDDPQVLYAVATTRQMNPTISEQFIAQELQRDPIANRAEYLSIPREDVSSFLDTGLIDRATREAPLEIPHSARTGGGVIGLDVSAGKGDATSVAYGRVDGSRVIIDAVRHWPSPHDPAEIAKRVAEFCREYHTTRVIADNYGSGVTHALYRAEGITITPAEATRSETYMGVLGLFTSGRIEIPDHAVLRRELLGLERKAGRNGKDVVDHSPYGGHDDVANAVALVAHRLSSRPAALSPEDLVRAVRMGTEFDRSDFEHGAEPRLTRDFPSF